MISACYSPKDGSVTMCFEIIGYFVVMLSDIELASEGDFSAAGRGGRDRPGQR